MKLLKHVTTCSVIAAVSQKSFSFGSTNETLITIMIHHCLTLRSEKSCSRADGIVNCAGASFNMLVTRLQQAKNVIVSYARVISPLVKYPGVIYFAARIDNPLTLKTQYRPVVFDIKLSHKQ